MLRPLAYPTVHLVNASHAVLFPVAAVGVGLAGPVGALEVAHNVIWKRAYKLMQLPCSSDD